MLAEPAAVAVDRTRGIVFISDVGAGVVDVYDSSGAFVTKFGTGSLFAAGIAVDEATGQVYVANSYDDDVIVFKAADGGYEPIGEWEGTALADEEFGEPAGVAVDNDPQSASFGDVYVVDGEDAALSRGVVDVFKPRSPGAGEGEEGTLVRVLAKGAMEEPNGVAVDAGSGRVYIADSEKGVVYEYSATGEYEGKMNGGSAPQGSFHGTEEEEGNVSAVAVDPVSDDLLVAEAERGVVNEFSDAGQWVGSITSTPDAPIQEPMGLAVSADGRIYVGDTSLARVDVFGPGVTVPDVTTEKSAKPTRTSAVVGGTIDGEGKSGHYFFQWGTTESLGSSTAPVVFPGGTEQAAVTLSELQAGTTYFFRLVAENENGASYGLIREFTTPPAVDKLVTGSVKDVEPDDATVTGSLAPDGFDAHYYFQWGTTTAYGNAAPAPPGVDAGAEKGAVSAEATLSELSPNTVYHYRLVATNSFGATYGADQKFTTSGPPRITSKPASAIGHETATLNAEINPDELATTYHFEYGETSSYGAEAPAEGASAGSGSAPVAVSVTLSHLKLGITYHYRVVAENAAPGSPTFGSDQTFTTTPPALITSYATTVNATTATLDAEINPLGNETTYYFQYGTQACVSYPQACIASPAAPGEDIGAGEVDVGRALTLTGLTPDTLYHYRVIATNILGESIGAEHTLRTQQPVQISALPDGRAWEMVTPPDKEGSPVEALTREGGIILASEDGDRFTYLVDGALGEDVQGNRSPEWQQVLATRGTESWSSEDIATPNAKVKGTSASHAPEYQDFSPDLASALDEPWGSEPSPPLAPGVTQNTPYIRDTATGGFAPLLSEANMPAGLVYGTQVHFVSATPNLQHVVLSSGLALSGPGSAPGLYEWFAGKLKFVTRLAGGEAPPGKTELGFANRVVAGAVSKDGSRIIWTARPEGGVEALRGHLYLRDTVREETVQVDAASGVEEPAKGSAQFQAASSDGSRIFFTDKQRLTRDSTAEAAQGTGKPDLYECEVVEVEGRLACRLSDLTVDLHEGEHAFVQNLIFGIGEDGSDVYLVARGVLAINENGAGETAQPGGYNLYHLNFDGSHWVTTFIANLAEQDGPEWEGADLYDLAYVTARVSPSGRYLAFMSAASPTGYDNVDANPQAKGAHDEEVYLYDSEFGTLRCVSCNPTGARPSGVLDQNESGEGLGLLVDRRQVWVEAGREYWLGGSIPGWTAQSLTSASIQSRYLDDDGRLYFDSPDELVPAAKNHKENVYEYEPSGVGSCSSPSGGCVGLLSSGTSDRESAFIEATPSGSDVFFVTESQLLPQDTDTAFDIYDARTCTVESPCQTVPATPPGGCEEVGTCRPAAPAEQIAGAPGGSGVLSGPGNPTAARPRTQVEGAQKSKPATKALTRKQQLANALSLCRRTHRHSKRKRAACERVAHRRFGAKHPKHGSAAKAKAGRPSIRGRHRS